MKYTKTIGRKLLKLLPQAKAVAVDRDGGAYWYLWPPTAGNNIWGEELRWRYYLGQFDSPKNWKDTLMTRKYRRTK